MTYRFSAPADLFFQRHDTKTPAPVNESDNRFIDTLIVGSGYGAAMTALALAEKNSDKQHRIVVLERGDEYLPEDFPRSIEDIPPTVGVRRKRNASKNDIELNTDNTRNRLQELWDVRYGDGAITITGSGLGGTSLVNASVVLRPENDIFENWPQSDKQKPWPQRLEQYYKKIEQLLGVETTPDVQRFAKYRALQNTVQQLDKAAQVVPAPVSIDFNSTSPYSVDHERCNYCGNCVTGCHSGAKQSLNLNAWPLAVQLGVELFTGVTVNRLEQSPGFTVHNSNEATPRWTVHVRKTSNSKEEIAIHANRVILAAGTLGSTSILHRSRNLSLSKLLGQKFSVNGDTVKFGVGQKKRVNAVADAPETDSDDPPGPTITGVGKVRLEQNSDSEKIILEDGAMPFALTQIWNEMLATQSLISQYAGHKRSHWHQKNETHDTLAVSNDLAEHSQVFLTMGRDKGQGKLIPDGAADSSNPKKQHDTELLPFWNSDTDDYHRRVDTLFTDEKIDAFDGGISQPNPAWQLIPPGVSSMIEGAGDLPSSVVSVHPIGGCAMGLNSSTGVVNCQGQVFQNNPDDTERVYDDLYVLDAAIIPTAIGVNPLLTISSLAYALASDIQLQQNAKPIAALTTPFPLLEKETRRMPARTRQPALARKDIRTEAIFRERLFWDLTKDKRPTIFLIERLQTLFGAAAIPADAKVLILDINFVFDKNQDGIDTNLEAWLQKPDVALSANASLRVSRSALLHTSEDLQIPEASIASFVGEVNLGNTSDSTANATSQPQKFIRKLQSGIRAALAVRRYTQFRWLDIFDNNSTSSIPEQIKGYWRFARMHSRWHYLDYRLRPVSSESNPSPTVRIAGRKTLAYRPGGKTLWEALTILPMVLSTKKQGLTAEFSVDLIRIVDGPSPLQVTNEASTPHAITSIAQLGSYFFRTLLKTHFWSMAALPYKSFPSREEIDKDRLEDPPDVVKLVGSPVLGERQKTYVHQPDLARLVHYSVQKTHENDSDNYRPSIMFTHGLAHGTRLFWTSDTRENYLQYFLKSGFDVWLLDHRASANYRRVVDNEHSVDDLASDVSWAVKTIYSHINQHHSHSKNESPNLVHVLAHCVGAAATSMAAFRGDLQQETNKEKSMLASFSLHAVTPWLFGSAENRARQNLWWFIDSSGAVKELDSTGHNDPSWTHMVFDRIAHTMMTDHDRRQWGFLEKWKDPKARGYTRGVYTRYRFFYGPEFNFFNVSSKLRKRFYVHAGITPIQSVKQMFLSVVGKRLVNTEMENEYLTADNLKRYWQFPTLFYHGHDNKVFDIESSRLSAFSLARFRQGLEDVNLQANEDPSTDDYTKFGVQLKTLENYGHMDMIFGEQATRDIGPELLAFLDAAEQQLAASNGANAKDYSVFAKTLAAHDHKKGHKKPEALPISSAIPERLPSAGPVLSHVTDDAIRLWLETDDYDTHRLDSVNIRGLAGPIAKDTLEMPRLEQDDDQNGRFWLYKLTNPHSISGPVSVSASYPSVQPSAITLSDSLAPIESIYQPPKHTQQNQPMHLPYTTNFSSMPWYQREFGNAKLDNEREKPTRLSIALGSCLHPGTPFESDKSDSIFAGIWKHALGNTGMTTTDESAEVNAPIRELDLMLLLGDQIYADATAELFDSKDYYERYRKRYRSAWTGTWMRRVMSHLPTHFVIDDHEFHDNFDGDPDQSSLYNIKQAKREAHNFQLHLPTAEQYKPQGSELQFWHSFDRLGFPFFCFDTRFERAGKKDGTLESLFGKELNQWNGFTDWLSANSEAKVLLIASGSPICPIDNRIVSHPELAHKSDGLLAYPAFFKNLIEVVCQKNPEAHIIWLSGDPHFSSFANIELSAFGKSIQITSITASGLFAAIPFANALVHKYSWGRTQSLTLDDDVQIEFTQQLLSDAHQQFSRLDISIESRLMTIASHGPDGKPLCSSKEIAL